MAATAAGPTSKKRDPGRTTRMPRGSKAKYTQKQKRTAEHIEERYRERGTSRRRAEGISWATVNKMYGGGAEGGSGSRRIQDKSPARRGGRKGGRAAARRPAAKRRAAARKAARTRKARAKRR